MTRPDGTRQGQGQGEGDGERIFAALPPARGRAFARTWWGVRWLKALEDTALEAEQLRRGRRLARQGAVGAVSVRPGRLTAVVLDADGAPQRADVLLRELTDAEWGRLYGVAGREAGHVAALLDREMPPRLVADAESAEVELLPGIGDLDATCECEAWDLCPHAAALCYQAARLLDEDPFVLLLLRGRTESRFLAGLGMRGTGAAAPEGAMEPDGAAATDGADGDGGMPARGPGRAAVPAALAYSRAAAPPPLPALPEPVTEPGTPPSPAGGTPPAPPGLDLDALQLLARDAAARARRMLQEALSPAYESSAPPVPLTRRQDAVRLAAHGPDGRMTGRLARGCGLTPDQLATAVRAWQLGGAEGLSVWEEPWTPDPQTQARMRDQFSAALVERGRESAPESGGEPASESAGSAGSGLPEGAADLHAEGNRWSTPDGAAQLRCGRDGRWWPWRRDGNGAWWPAGGPERDPAAALAVAAGEGEPGRDGRA